MTETWVCGGVSRGQNHNLDAVKKNNCPSVIPGERMSYGFGKGNIYGREEEKKCVRKKKCVRAAVLCSPRNE